MSNEADFMKERPVLPLILSMSIPMVVSMLVNSLYNIVDSLFVAKISEDAMTALSLVYPVQNFINAVGIGFGVGVNAVISFHLGSGDREKADRAAGQALMLSLLHSLVLTVAGMAVIPAFLGMFTQDQAVLDLGVRYARTAFPFTVMIVVGLIYEKFFQALGRMTVSMAALMAGCLANIVLDPMMIFGLGPFPAMGIQGAALATGLGQTISLVLYLIVDRVRPMGLTIRRRDLIPHRETVLRLYAIGIPATLNLALPSVLIGALNAILAAWSSVYVLVLGIYYKLQTFLYLPANGFVQGMRPLVGFNYGARAYRRVAQIYKYVLIMSGAIMALGTAVCLAVPDRLMALFTDNPQTIQAGGTALRVISAGFLFSAVSITSSGALEGLGKGAPSLVISMCRYVAVILPAAFLLSRLLGPEGVWHAFWITEVFSAAVAYAVYRRVTPGRAAQ